MQNLDITFSGRRIYIFSITEKTMMVINVNVLRHPQDRFINKESQKDNINVRNLFTIFCINKYLCFRENYIIFNYLF